MVTSFGKPNSKNNEYALYDGSPFTEHLGSQIMASDQLFTNTNEMSVGGTEPNVRMQRQIPSDIASQLPASLQQSLLNLPDDQFHRQLQEVRIGLAQQAQFGGDALGMPEQGRMGASQIIDQQASQNRMPMYNILRPAVPNPALQGQQTAQRNAAAAAPSSYLDATIRDVLKRLMAIEQRFETTEAHVPGTAAGLSELKESVSEERKQTDEHLGENDAPPRLRKTSFWGESRKSSSLGRRLFEDVPDEPHAALKSQTPALESLIRTASPATMTSDGHLVTNHPEHGPGCGCKACAAQTVTNGAASWKANKNLPPLPPEWANPMMDSAFTRKRPITGYEPNHHGNTASFDFKASSRHQTHSDFTSPPSPSLSNTSIFQAARSLLNKLEGCKEISATDVVKELQGKYGFALSYTLYVARAVLWKVLC